MLPIVYYNIYNVFFISFVVPICLLKVSNFQILQYASKGKNELGTFAPSLIIELIVLKSAFSSPDSSTDPPRPMR